MKYPALFWTLCAGLLMSISSCRIQTPAFRRVENLRFETVNNTGFRLAADAVFYNPNRIRCKVTDIAFDAYLNDTKLGTLGEKKDIRINGRSEFALPLAIAITPLENLGSLFKNILSLISKKDGEVKLQGVLMVKAYGVQFKVPVTESQRIDLSKLKQ